MTAPLSACPAPTEPFRQPARSLQSLKGRSLVTIDDLTSHEIEALVGDAIRRKAARRQGAPSDRSLSARNICLVFASPSCRTRSAFQVAIADEGGFPHAMTADELRLGSGESLRDIARVLSRMFDGIAIRAADTALVAEIARHASVPVWNAMTNQDHPTQALADLMTLSEAGIAPGDKIAFVGHGRGNVCVSLAKACLKVGYEIMIVTPPGCEPEPELLAMQPAHPSGKILASTAPWPALVGAKAVYADMWVNTCLKGDVDAECVPFQPYRITEELMRMTMQRTCIFLHCLPSQHNPDTAFARAHPAALDTDEDVFEGPRSKVFEQAENRMHTIKSLILATIPPRAV